MFDLERAIEDWRAQMLAAGIKFPAPLEELEIHLREDIEQQLRQGIGAPKAFLLTVQRMGSAFALKTEFEKNNESKIMKRTLVIGAGIVGILVGMAFVMPAVAQYRHTGAMSNGEPWLFLLGSLLTLAGAGAGIVAATKRQA